jgi:hypothetical protein
MSLIIITSPQWLADRGLEPNARFWALWVWAVVDVIHAHVYKITFGARDTMEYILKSRRWKEARNPLGGAIGRQLKRIRHYQSISCQHISTN